MKNLDGTAIGKIDHSLSHACRTDNNVLTKRRIRGQAKKSHARFSDTCPTRNVRTRRLGI